MFLTYDSDKIQTHKNTTKIHIPMLINYNFHELKELEFGCDRTRNGAYQLS
jgi:hypothetical protein